MVYEELHKKWLQLLRFVDGSTAAFCYSAGLFSAGGEPEQGGPEAPRDQRGKKDSDLCGGEIRLAGERLVGDVK
jgi:hypothetical protein